MVLSVWFYGLSGCTSYVEEYEIDPNRPQKATVQTLLSSAEVHTFSLYSGNFARILSIFMQSQCGIDRQYAAHSIYKLSESDVNNDWTNAYAGGLMDAQTLIAQAQEEKKPHYVALGKIVKAMQLGFLSACWGDVPNREAFQGAQNRNPHYDGQEIVYQDVQTLLDEGINLLHGEAGTVNGAALGSDDLIHGGDVQKWIGTAYILKARFYNHLSKLDPSGSAQKALAALDSAYAYQTSSAGDCNAVFGANASNNNLWYQFSTQRGDIAMGAFIVDTMLSLSDPRLPIYATTDAEGAYSGYPPGGSSDLDPYGVSFLGVYFGGYDPNNETAGAPASAGMVTFAEAKFIEAECALRAGDAARAQAAYTTGLDAALSLPGVENSAAYRQSQLEGPLTLEKIMFQKYMALFTQAETWTDYRRTGFPRLKPPPGLSLDAFPRRFPTALSERQNNSSAPVITSTITPRMWWDK